MFVFIIITIYILATQANNVDSILHPSISHRVNDSGDFKAGLKFWAWDG